MLFIGQSNEWSVRFEQPDRTAFFTEPTRVFIYSYRTMESLEAIFLPVPHGRIPKESRRASLGNTCYIPKNEGIVLDDACFRGISEVIVDLSGRGELRRFFRPAPPPVSRWSTLPLKEIPLPSAAEEFRATLAGLYVNGSVLLNMYEVADPQALQACLRSQELISPIPQTELLRNPALAGLPALALAKSEAPADCQWEFVGPFHLAAAFATLLFHGGAYHSMRPNHQRARELAEAARISLWGDNYETIYTWSCGDPWTEWFFDVAWDSTFLSFDFATSRIMCLFTTDTD